MIKLPYILAIGMINGLGILGITISVILLFLFIPVIIAILTAIFQWLWNITMPQVFALRTITFWQAFRLLIIAGFLFGGVHYASNSDCNQKLTTIDSKLNEISGKMNNITNLDSDLRKISNQLENIFKPHP